MMTLRLTERALTQLFILVLSASLLTMAFGIVLAHAKRPKSQQGTHGGIQCIQAPCELPGKKPGKTKAPRPDKITDGIECVRMPCDATDAQNDNDPLLDSRLLLLNASGFDAS
jgi:hypothetical protein